MSTAPAGRERSFLDMTVREYLDGTAAPVPSGTGGTVNAVTLAAAAGLVSMVARLSENMSAAESVVASVEDLRRRAAELADKDAEAYSSVLSAQRLPSGSAERGQALREALAEAAGPPQRLAGLAAELTEIAADVAARGKPSLRGDAATAANLAAGVYRASTSLARTNLTAAGRNWQPDTATERATRQAEQLAGAGTGQ